MQPNLLLEINFVQFNNNKVSRKKKKCGDKKNNNNLNRYMQKFISYFFLFGLSFSLYFQQV